MQIYCVHCTLRNLPSIDVFCAGLHKRTWSSHPCCSPTFEVAVLPGACVVTYTVTRLQPKPSTWSVRSSNMSNNHSSSERTPLLGNEGAAGGATDGEGSSKPSTWHRIESWAASHVLSISLGLLAALFFAFFLVALVTRLPGTGKSPFSPPPSDEAKICTAEGCVLASATLLRSISPRYATSLLTATITSGGSH